MKRRELTLPRLAKAWKNWKWFRDLTGTTVPSGPGPGTEWSVTPRSDGFAVGRSSEPWAVFTSQEHACLAAAILPQADEGLIYRLIPRDDSKLPGFDVVTLGSDLVRARRAWLWGIVHLDVRAAEAEARLREAADLFRKIGLDSDTAQALVDLGRHYALDQRSDGLRQVTWELAELMRRSDFSREQRRTIADQAAAIGIDRRLLEPSDEPCGELIH